MNYPNDFLNQVIEGDCLEVMKDIPEGKVSLILTDPPYGIGYQNDVMRRKSNQHFDLIEGDEQEMDFSFLLQRKEQKIIFGANNFYKQLPHKGIWLCWDKRVKESADKILGSAFELAWCSKTNGYYKIYRIMHGGTVNADKKFGGTKERFHPTQKPIELMARIIKDFTKEGDIILDPFLGSGTTAIAAQLTNRSFIGIEISKEYCEIARERLRQNNLFA